MTGGASDGRAEPAVASPGSLIVTFSGLYLRSLGGWIAVADLISLLSAAGQPPTAVRQALVRLKSRGFLAAERQRGRAGYRLTGSALADLTIGDARIFRYGEAEISDGWVLAIFSVPESARAERHRLRTQLAWLGFGTVGAGVWIAPAALAQRSRDQMDQQGLGGYVTWFSARSIAAPDVGTWWDLGALRALYRDFLDRWQGHPDAADGADTGPGAQQSFANYLYLLDSWRQFPRIDPGLPASLLPADWHGRRAFELFSALRERWSGPAEHFVRQHVTE